MKRIILQLSFSLISVTSILAANDLYSSLSAPILFAPPPVCSVTVTNTFDGSPTVPVGSLRAAINFANSNPGLDTICFAIPGAGVHTIFPVNNLPPITDPVVIDGFSQPGSSANTLSAGNNAVNLIEIQRGSAGLPFGLEITTAGGGSTVRGLVVNNFRFSQILINSSSGNTIAGNYIGTNAAGTSYVGGGGSGIEITGGAGNVIGGTTPADANLVSGNGIDGSPSFVTGNPGIFLNGGFIKPAPSIPGNICISTPRSITGTIIQGNLIGTDHTGTSAIGNSTGVYIACSATTGTIVGGTSAAERNVISGNRVSADGRFGQGVLIALGAHDNNISGNYIGTDPIGSVAVPNQTFGVSVGFGAGGTGAPNNVIGGTVPGSGNVISGNNLTAVLIQQGSSGNKVQSNLIGTNATATAALPNGGSGVVFNSASNNTVGFTSDGLPTGPGVGNVIANNAFRGVGVNSGTGNLIARNSVFNNNALGIDILGNGPTANDPCDSDGGPNGSQNYPVFSSVSIASGVATFSGSLNSTAGTTFYLEFFANSSQDPSGYGEGKDFLGSGMVTTGSGCTAGFSGSFTVPSGTTSISATATDTNNRNTSEFSPWFAATSTALSTSVNPSVHGQSVTFTATVSSDAGTPGGTVTFYDGATAIGNGTLDGGGHATFATSSLGTGSHSITAVYNGGLNFAGSTSTDVSQVVNKANTTTSLSSDQNSTASGQTVTFTATAAAVAPGAGTPTGTVTFKDGATVLGTVTVDGSGNAVFTTSSLTNGYHSITATYNGDGDFNTSMSNTASQLIYGYLAGGSFVIGDQGAVVGRNVTFWDATWSAENEMTGGYAPSSFKGFANQLSSNPPSCGGSWLSDPGNSSGPPASVPGYMAVIVAGSITKNGSIISGNIARVVVVRTNPGYGPSPGHPGTGTVVAIVCQ